MAQAAKGVKGNKFSFNIKYSYFKTGLTASHAHCIVFKWDGGKRLTTHEKIFIYFYFFFSFFLSP